MYSVYSIYHIAGYPTMHDFRHFYHIDKKSTSQRSQPISKEIIKGMIFKQYQI